MKKILLVFLFIFPLLSCREETNPTNNIARFVPPEAAIVLKTENLSDFSEKLAANSLLGKPDFPMRSEIENELKSLQHLNVKDESLLCFSIIGRDVVFTFIVENRPDLISNIENKTESFQYDGQNIHKYNVGGNVFYAVVLDNIFVGSGSKLIVENMVRLFNLGLNQNAEFEKIYATSGKNSVFVQTENFSNFYRHFFPKGKISFLKDFSNWTVLDVSLEKNGLYFNGVLPDALDEKNRLNLFKGLRPQKIELAQICPLNAMGFFAFGYDDFSILKENLHRYRKKSVPAKMDALFASANEIGILYFSNGEAVALKSSDVKTTENALLAHRKKIDEFRGNPIYSFSEETAFATTFSPLVAQKKLRFYTRLGRFFIFSEHQKTLENSIANFQNGSVVSAQNYFQDLSENLTDESSIYFLGINENLKKPSIEKSGEKLGKEIEKFNLNNYKLSALQFIRDEGFSHINIAMEHVSDVAENKGPAQLFSLDLENSVAGNPQFFEYWRTGEFYTVAQDRQNFLYLFDNSGKMMWKIPLDGKILGDIQTVDLYKNTRLQMAFATSNKMYIVGIDGKIVSPFPLEFNSPITQPLAIFDYAENRNYRFVIVQNEKISMWDNHAKKVSGFAFKAKSSVAESPKHFRIGTKDYIVVPEVSGKLNILDRQGKPRILVEKKFELSENPWFLFENKFTSTDAKGNLLQVDEKGKLSTKELGLLENHKIATSGKTFVSLSENILNINGKKLELDYGLYTAPKIFEFGGKTYVNVTDTQASKVYLFDAEGNLLPGFPVYGNSSIDLKNMDGKGGLEFTVKGEDDSVLVYGM